MASVPDFQVMMLPALRGTADGATSSREIRDAVARQLRLDDEQLSERLASGQTRFMNRCAWALAYLGKAQLIERTGRGRYQVTGRGREVLSEQPEGLDIEYLRRFPEFLEFCKKNRRSPAPVPTTLPPEAVQTPEERIEEAATELEESLASELLDRIVASPPEFFERLVVDLVLKMGYGTAGRGQHVGRTADGGIDGIVTEDALGLSVILLQAKRYAPGNTVGVEKIKEFAGTLDERGATKGIFVTTSCYSSGASEYVKRSPKKIVLIDGERLSELMIQYCVGLRTTRTVEIRKVDLDYFEVDE